MRKILLFVAPPLLAKLFDLAPFCLLLIAGAIFFLPKLYGPKLPLTRAFKDATTDKSPTYHKRGWRSYLMQGIALILVGTALFTCHYFRDIWLSEEVEFFHEEIAGEFDWYLHKETKFSLLFPQKPIRIQSALPVPKSKEVLHLEEYKSKGNGLDYSLSYLNFPKRWLRWGSSLILKGSLKMIARTIPGARIVRTSKMKYRALPSLEYVMALAHGKEAAGRLILQDNRLYRIEATYLHKERENVRHALAHFIQSFQPQKGKDTP